MRILLHGRPIRRRDCLLAAVALAFAAGPSAAQQSQPSDPPPAPAVTAVAAGKDVSIRYWNPKEAIEKGGPIMWPIVFCSLVTITFGLERLITLRRGRVIPSRFVRRFLRGVV